MPIVWLVISLSSLLSFIFTSLQVVISVISFSHYIVFLHWLFVVWDRYFILSFSFLVPYFVAHIYSLHLLFARFHIPAPLQPVASSFRPCSYFPFIAFEIFIYFSIASYSPVFHIEYYNVTPLFHWLSHIIYSIIICLFSYILYSYLFVFTCSCPAIFFSYQ